MASNLRFDLGPKEVAVLPGTLLFAWSLTIFFPPHILSFLVCMPMHEFGHALAAWILGYPAFPTLFGFTFIGEERWTSLLITIWALLVFSSVVAFLKNRWFYFAHCLVILSLMTLGAFFTTHGQRMALISWGGMAGEWVISGWFLVAFHSDVSKQFRWDFWRFPGIFVGSLGFVLTTKMWIAIYLGKAQLPWGSALGESFHGDLEKLRDTWHWTPSDIALSYELLGVSVCASVILHYVLFAAIQLRDRRFRRSLR